jgi:hypothetical protein
VGAPWLFFDDAASAPLANVSPHIIVTRRCSIRLPFANPSLQIIDGASLWFLSRTTLHPPAEVPPHRAVLVNQINNPRANFRLERNIQRLFNRARDIAPARVNAMIRVGKSPGNVIAPSRSFFARQHPLFFFRKFLSLGMTQRICGNSGATPGDRTNRCTAGIKGSFHH